METKDILYHLRTKKGLSQEELAEKLLITRQAVSRWENGDTLPNIETLKILSNKELIGINQDAELNRPYLLRCGDGSGQYLQNQIPSAESDKPHRYFSGGL